MQTHFLLMLILCGYIVSCTSESGIPFMGGRSSDNKAQGDQGRERITVGEATGGQCAAGGKIYTVYLDVNGNGIEDATETPLSVQIVCNGQNGADGTNGTNGTNGHSVQFSVLSAVAEICPAGGYTLLMALDIDDRGFYSVADPNQQQMTLCNGDHAPTPQYSPMDVIFPCGNTVAYKEVLLRLNDGQVLASFSEKVNGENTRLSLIPDGTFMTTDGTNCTFTLATSGSTRSIGWDGHIQKSWPLTP